MSASGGICRAPGNASEELQTGYVDGEKAREESRRAWPSIWAFCRASFASLTFFLFPVTAFLGPPSAFGRLLASSSNLIRSLSASSLFFFFSASSSFMRVATCGIVAEFRYQ